MYFEASQQHACKALLQYVVAQLLEIRLSRAFSLFILKRFHLNEAEEIHVKGVKEK